MIFERVPESVESRVAGWVEEGGSEGDKKN